MLNKKVSLIITVALSAALLLSGCGSSTAELVDETVLESTFLQTSVETTTTTETTHERKLTPDELKIYDSMPDTVFVKYSYYPGEQEYKTGTFAGISGYYIDKNGYIKYFEFEHDKRPEILGEDEGKFIEINIEEYSDYRKLNEFSKKIVECSTDTDLKPISKEDLINYYKLLLKINSKEKLGYESSYLTLVYGLNCFYGVRINENNEEEYILIHEDGDLYYVNDNKYAEDLYEKLMSALP